MRPAPRLGQPPRRPALEVTAYPTWQFGQDAHATVLLASATLQWLLERALDKK